MGKLDHEEQPRLVGGNQAEMFVQGNPGSMIVPTDLEVNLQFSPDGVHVARVDHSFKQGEDAELVLTDFMKAEECPAYLHLNLLSVMHSLLESERRAASQIHVQRPDEVNKGLKAWSANFGRAHAETNFVTGEAGQQESGESNPTNQAAELKRFASEFLELLQGSGGRNETALEAVLDLEGSYAVALAELTDERESGMADMQNRQSVEMENVCMQTSLSTAALMEDGMVQDPVARTVMCHLKETELKQSEWGEQFEKVIRSQRSEYRTKISELHTQLQSSEYVRLAALAKAFPQDSGSASSFRYQQQQTPVAADLEARMESIEPTAPSAAHSSFFNLFYSKNEGADGEAAEALATAEALVENHVGEDQICLLFQTSYGKLRGPEYRVVMASTKFDELLNGEEVAAERAHSTPERGGYSDARVQTLMSLYGEELSGVVLIIDTDMSYSTPSPKALVEKCQKAPELHFDTFNTQTSVLDVKLKEEGGLQPGDFFITHHSCLEHVHVIFHLAAGRNDVVFNPDAPDLYDKAPILSGLSRILMAANQSGVASLAIPIMLLDDGWHQAISTAQTASALRRAEKVLQCVKTFFLDYKGDDGSLRSICFLTPDEVMMGSMGGTDDETTISFTEQCRKLVIETFKQEVCE